MRYVFPVQVHHAMVALHKKGIVSSLMVGFYACHNHPEEEAVVLIGEQRLCVECCEKLARES